MKLVLIPAYGRAYKTVDKMLEDWHNGKDFRIHGGPYCSIRDLRDMSMRYWDCDIILHDLTTKIHHVIHRGIPC